jgi:hypothetical protein
MQLPAILRRLVMALGALPIRAEGTTVGQLLSSSWFRVPDYQRPYAWTEDEVRELWEDLLTVLRAEDEARYHFFGTLLSVDSGRSASSQSSPLELLDGQQRLATFALLMIAIDRELEEIEGSDEASSTVREAAREARRRIAEALFRTPDSREARRLQLRAEEDQLLSNIIHGNPPGKGRLGDAFRELHGAVRGFAEGSSDLVVDLRKLTQIVLDRSIVIHARCVYGFDPFAVFATLNARGLPLRPAQVLRARMLGLVSEMPTPVHALTTKSWDLVESMDEDGDRFLAYYLTTRTGKRTPTKEVVRYFDREILTPLQHSGTKEQGFGALADELHSLGALYRDIGKGIWPQGVGVHASEWRKRRLRLLTQDLGVKQAIPLILAVCRRAPDALVEVLDIIERAAFVALMCFPNQTKWGDQLFEWAKAMYEGDMDSESLREAVRIWFLGRLGDPARTLSEYLPVQLRYGGRKRTLLRYFLTTLNDYGFPKPQPGRPDEQAQWDLRKVQIDHISARTLPDGVPPYEKDRLGNLTPLYGPVNAALSDRPFDEKRSAYAESPLRMTKQLAEIPEWNATRIRKREEQMVKFAVALYCRDMQIP